MAPKKKRNAGKRKNVKKPAAAVKKGFVDDINRDLMKALSNPEIEGLMPVEVLKLANKFSSLKNLIPKCKLRIEKAINRRYQSALEILPAILDEKDLGYLKKCAVAKIARHRNVKELLECGEFQQLPLKAFREILKEGLVIKIEHLKGPISQWAKCQIHRRNEEEFPGGGEIVEIPVEDIAAEIYGAIQGLRFPNISLQDLIGILESNDIAGWEVDAAEVVLKEEIDIEDKKFLNFSALDNDIANGDEQGEITKNPAQDENIVNQNLSNITSASMEFVESESAVDILPKNGGELNSPKFLELDGQVINEIKSDKVAFPDIPIFNPASRLPVHNGKIDNITENCAAGPLAVDSDYPGNAENGQNNWNEEGDLEREAMNGKEYQRDSLGTSDEAPPQPSNSDPCMELEDRNDDRAAAIGNVGGGVDEGTIPQAIKTEDDKKFYIDDIKEDPDSGEEDYNVSICNLSESAKTRKRMAIPEIPICNAASRCSKGKIDTNDQKLPNESTSSNSPSFGLKPAFVSLKRLSAAQIPTINIKTGVKSKPGWKCPHCQKIYRCKSILEMHIRIHTGERPFNCPHCLKTFTNPANLRVHIRNLHPKETQNLFSCRHCPNKFPSRITLSKHMKKHLKCYFCPQMVGDLRALRNHLGTHTMEKPLKCPHCPYSVVEEHNLKRHIRSKHANANQPLNSRRYLLSGGVWRVYETSAAPGGSVDVDGGADLELKDEGAIPQIKNEGDEKFHITEENDSDSEDDDNTSIRNFSESANTARKQRPPKKKYSTTTAAKASKKKLSSKLQISTNALNCPHCSKIFSCKSVLERHIRSHKGERPLPNCPKALQRKKSLRRHIRAVHPEVNQIDTVQNLQA